MQRTLSEDRHKGLIAACCLNLSIALAVGGVISLIALSTIWGIKLIALAIIAAMPGLFLRITLTQADSAETEKEHSKGS